MKGITIIVILSIVGSIISGIVEKRKAAATKKARQGSSPQPTIETNWKADPVKVKIESLRRRRVAQQGKSASKHEQPIQPPIREEIKPIASLHVEDCPLPPAKSALRNKRVPAKQLATMLRNKRNIRTAIVLSEILSKPVSQRS
ncbi:MAG TPA: hypothetical protein EYQ00_13535 [Dehalococcoidia bacterium]|nr:hypothetical protein [Dehalococcoidia bacterium]